MADIKIKPLHRNIIAGVGILVLAIVLLVPGILPTIGAMFTTQVSSCEDTPYDPDCVCELGVERKISVPWLGIPRSDCEVLADLLIDPESPNFEAEAIAFAEEYLSRWCSNIATDFSCGDAASECIQGNPIWPNNKCIQAGFGYNASGERIASIECIEVTEWDSQNRPVKGNLPWRMRFQVESTTGVPTTMFPESNYYYNADTQQKCTHQSVCDFIYANPNQFTIDNPNWCVGTLPLDVIPFTPDALLSIASRSGYGDPSPQ